MIGVLSERGQGLNVSNEDDQVYVRYAAMRRLMNLDHYGAIAVPMGTMDAAARRHFPSFAPSIAFAGSER